MPLVKQGKITTDAFVHVPTGPNCRAMARS